MPKRPDGLVNRKGSKIYYCRKRVPDRLIPILGRKEFMVSLKTSDFQEAKRKLRPVKFEIEQKIEAAEQKLERSKSRQPATLSDEEIKAMAIDWFIKHEQDLNRKYRNLQPEGIEAAVDGLRGDLEAACLEYGINDAPYHYAEEEVDKILKKHEIKVDKSGEEYARLKEWILRGFIESYERKLAQIDGSFSQRNYYRAFADVDHLSSIQGQNKQVGKSRGIKISELTEMYISDRKVHSSSIKKYRHAMSSLCKHIGDIFIRDVSYEDFIRYRDHLDTKPKRLSRVTINNHFDILSSMFQFAYRQEWINRNYASGVGFKLSADEKAEGLRNPFSMDELSVIFSAPIYSGCIDDENNYRKAGPNNPRRERFWIPLVALFTGMRLSEICQLYVSDITVQDGIQVISLSTFVDGRRVKDKHLKNESSRRSVPIHTELIRMGLLNYVEEQRALGRQRVFPRLKFNPKTEKYSDQFSKWFGRFLTHLELKREGRNICFHSFRHTFADAARFAGIDEQYYEKIGGWKTDDRTSRRYGGWPIALLNEQMQKIRYEGLDLSHLYAL